MEKSRTGIIIIKREETARVKEEFFFLPNFMREGGDAHAHLPWNPSRGACVLNATRPSEWEELAGLAREYPQEIIPAFGVHPWFVEELEEGWLEKLRGYLLEFAHAWVGEVGLDKSGRYKASFALQKEVLIAQMSLASELERPLSLHMVRSVAPLLEILEGFEREKKGKAFPFLLCHGYRGATEGAKALLAFNAYFSLTEQGWSSEKGLLLKELLAPSRCLRESDC